MLQNPEGNAVAIIYLHGFAGAGSGSTKAKMLQERFRGERVLAPDLPVNPAQVDDQITALVRDLVQKGEQKILFVGSSLGGFYARYFAAKLDCPAFLVNPSIDAANSLAKRVGANINMITGQPFEWRAEYCDTLADMRDFSISHGDKKQLRCAVALDDDVIDPRQTMSALTDVVIDVYNAGGHRFDNGERLLPAIMLMYADIRKSGELVI